MAKEAYGKLPIRYAHRYMPLPLVPTYPVWYPAVKPAGMLERSLLLQTQALISTLQLYGQKARGNPYLGIEILGINGMPNLPTAYSVEIMNTNSLPRLDSDCLFCTDVRGNIYSGRERSRGQRSKAKSRRAEVDRL